MLQPIFKFLFHDSYLSLSKNQVFLCYKTYKSNDLNHMRAISDQKPAPGNDFSSSCHSNLFSVASVAFGHPGREVEHAMVLDTYDQNRDVLIF